MFRIEILKPLMMTAEKTKTIRANCNRNMETEEESVVSCNLLGACTAATSQAFLPRSKQAACILLGFALVLGVIRCRLTFFGMPIAESRNNRHHTNKDHCHRILEAGGLLSDRALVSLCALA